MEIRFNPMKITGIEAFGDVRGRTAAGVRSVYFIVGTGYYPRLSEDIIKLDRRLSADARCLYRRVTSFPLPGVKEAAEYGDKWDRLCKGEKVLPPETEAALKEVCALYRSARKDINPSIEKNLAAMLMFRADRLLEGMSCSDGKCPKLVCSGKAGGKEYLFCLMAAHMGIDVLLLSPAGEPSLPKGLARREELIRLGENREFTLPEYQPASTECAGSGTVAIASKAGARAPKAAVPAVSGKHIPLTVPRTPVKAPAASPAPTAPPAEHTAQNGEMSFEELATLASSVVMINLHNSRGRVIGSGSGIIIGRGGYILTNFHVAGGARSFSVQLENDENIYRTSEIIKYHPNLDLAILRIDRQLTPLKFYSGRDELRRGQKVVAIGSPLGLFNSVSDGIISGFREINGVDMIQFTAPISGGSSGGALLNMHGEVIGISTAGFSKGQNLNLAVGYKDIIPFVGNLRDQ
ncbi:MAG: S1C family serine protease [Huintestinicola sp.]|uniref:S1C family serine protease n=1 Tax=Huintestinicola sp. TaxID=2981661 RepID=UPI003F0875B6